MLQAQLVGQHCEQYEGVMDPSCLRGFQNQKSLWRGISKEENNLKRLKSGPCLPTKNDYLQEMGNMFRNHMENSMSLKSLKSIAWLRHSLVVEFKLSIQKPGLNSVMI